ncbi:PilN domain-containing protein [Gilvibacter sp.]|uniref:PilN domain-containing protein n=1 Tax=Gilvibacter sp. TaxID=2729997 RepID=UPI003F4A32B3
MEVRKLIALKQFFHCVHLHLDGTGSSYRCLKVGIKRQDLEIIQAVEADSISSLKEKLGTSLPLLLLISGAKVIDKKLTRSPNYLSEVLFNNSLDDFYLNEREQSEHMLISVARKNSIDPILAEFEAAGFELLEFRFGRWYLSAITELLPDQFSVMGYDPHSLSLTDFKDTKNSLSIGDQQFEESQSLALAMAVVQLQPGVWTTNYAERTTALKTEYKYKKWFKRLGAAVLVFLLTSLVGSYLLTAHYNEKNVSLQAEVAAHQQLQNEVAQLEKDKAFKDQVLEELQLGRKAYLSDYLWQIGASVPAEVQLESLVLFPLAAKVKDEEFIAINGRQLELSGVVSDTQSFVDWTEDLRAKAWISSVELTDFQRQQNTNTFKLTLHL